MKNIFLALFTFWAFPLFSQTDQIPAEKGDITVTPIFHGTVVFQWDGKTVYVDPYGGAERFENLPAPDLVLITHKHGDHLNKGTLKGLDLSNTRLIAPQSVVEDLGEITFSEVWTMKNGETKSWNEITVEAVPMYNLPADDTPRHPKGWGNGYVITMGGKRIYVSGDTEDIPEMRQLKDIDVAFVCMNLPYTMDVEHAASAVIDFKPAIMYPFHFRGSGGFSDVEKFKKLVNEGTGTVEVRLREWYSEK
jgi:L-ascorbate metabolism protein UlaG (beta-lactamase superfamily)